MTTPTVTIAALRTLNARLLQDNERLARENELLRAQLSTMAPATPSERPDRQMTGVASQVWVATETERHQDGARFGDLRPDLAAIAQESTTNAAVTHGSVPVGQLRSVVRSNLPGGPGITHTPSGVPLFDRPPGERRFLVGEARERGAETGTAASSAETNAPSTSLRSPSAPLRPPVRIVAGGMPVRRTQIASQAQPGQQPQPQPPQMQRSAPRPQAPSAPPAAPAPPTRAPSATTSNPSNGGDDASARFALLELD